MAEGLIVAAGLSERTGGHYKMTLDFGGRTLVERSISGMAPFCSRIIVVTGHNSEIVKDALAGYEGLEFVYNPDYREGMYSSIKAGLRHISGDRFFFLPGDCPMVPAEVYARLLEIDSEIVIPVYRNMKGHPVLFNHSVVEKILKNKSYTTLRQFIYANNPVFVEVGYSGILIDIDTLEDYCKALEILNRR